MQQDNCVKKSDSAHESKAGDRCCACGGETEDILTTNRTKHREGEEYKDLLCRISRIEGQVRGVRRMVEEDRYCVDILTQVSAISAALNSFNKVLLAQHIKSCVVNDIRAGSDEAVDELCATLQKLMK